MGLNEYFKRLDELGMADFKSPELVDETAQKEWQLRLDALISLTQRENALPGEVFCGNTNCRLHILPGNILDRTDRICFACGGEDLIPCYDYLINTREVPFESAYPEIANSK